MILSTHAALATLILINICARCQLEAHKIQLQLPGHDDRAFARVICNPTHVTFTIFHRFDSHRMSNTKMLQLNYDQHHITAFDDTTLLLAACISMSNASAASTALHLAFAAFHRPRPLAVCLARSRSHDPDEICN